MRPMRKSDWLTIVGLIVLLAGVVMSYFKMEPYADYVLVAGAVIIVFRGAFRARERDEKND